MRGAGVLDFRIAVNPAKPQGVNPDQLRKDLVTKGPRSGEPGTRAKGRTGFSVARPGANGSSISTSLPLSQM